jgi:hypothetical protein
MARATIIAALCCLCQTGRAAPPDAPDANLPLQYARARLELAEANLNRVEELNRRRERSVAPTVVAELHAEVDEARLQVERASQAEAGGEFDVWLRRAEGELASATSRWKKALQGNQRLKGAFEPLDVERYRLRAEVARLQLARGRSLVGASRGAQLEWQVELLNNEIDRLKEELMHTPATVRYYPIYWFW